MKTRVFFFLILIFATPLYAARVNFNFEEKDAIVSDFANSTGWHADTGYSKLQWSLMQIKNFVLQSVENYRNSEADKAALDKVHAETHAKAANEFDTKVQVVG